ncbi:hypothetical protein AGMMS50262_01900 [Bacteroidia bacterium]|nr:hypothetical protein AGMMS50262_01900 [Bacteroidia bacterium]
MLRFLFVWHNDNAGQIQPPVAIDNIQIQRSEPYDATLNSLKVSQGTLSPAFNPQQYKYTVDVAGNVSTIYLEAIPNNSRAAIIGANEYFELNKGANTFNILVISEDWNYINTYKVVVNRGNVGIDSPEAGTFNVYPNPTSGIVYIENPAGTEIQLYNSLGELIFKTKENQIDLSGYLNGVYVLRSGGNIVKVIKK